MLALAIRHPPALRHCVLKARPGGLRYASGHDHRASSKLWADAAREGEEEPASSVRPPASEHQHPNWTGEESIEDAVLRMLVDKYKPLRGGGAIKSAEEKLRDSPPPVVSSSSTISHSADWAQKPLLPAVEGHKPWHTTYKAPSAATSIKTGISSRLAQDSSRKPSDEHPRKIQVEQRKRELKIERLTKAVESTMDYKLGIKGVNSRRVNPVSLKGWSNLVEEKIEKARISGHFKNLNGRGRPLIRETAESNPFIAREEFLVNRIVQRNGAVPPWVDLQREFQAAITIFRTTLRDSWTRRALRVLLTSYQPSTLARLTLTDITLLRDREWEARERSYHDKLLDGVNDMVRKFNATAPYVVRKPYYMLSVELDKAYAECGEDILKGVKERLQGSQTHLAHRSGTASGQDSVVSVDGQEAIGNSWHILEFLRRWFSGLRKRADHRNKKNHVN